MSEPGEDEDGTIGDRCFGDKDEWDTRGGGVVVEDGPEEGKSYETFSRLGILALWPVWTSTDLLLLVRGRVLVAVIEVGKVSSELAWVSEL